MPPEYNALEEGRNYTMRCFTVGLILILFAATLLINLFLPDCVIIFVQCILLIIAGWFLLKKLKDGRFEGSSCTSNKAVEKNT